MNDHVDFGTVNQLAENAATAVDAAASLYFAADQRSVGDELMLLSDALRGIPASKLIKRGCAINLRFEEAERALVSARTLGIPQAVSGVTGDRRARIFLNAAFRHWQLAEKTVRKLADGTANRTERLRHTGAV